MIKYNKEYWQDVNLAIDEIPNINRIKGKKILITGASGMICSAIVEILFYLNFEANANIKIFLAGRDEAKIKHRFPMFTNGETYTFINFDAVNPDNNLNIPVDYIIYGASNAHPSVYTTQPVETIMANIYGLNSLLHMASKVHAERLLYISSSEVYGNIDEIRPYEESDYGFIDILNPRACYPCSKRAAETLCVAYNKEYDLDIVIARPGHIYGPSITDSDNRASAQFTRNAVKGENIIMKSSGMQLRSYCYTLDCASAILTILINGESGNAYNISNRDSVVSIKQIAEEMAKEVNKNVVYVNASDKEKKGYNLMTNSSLDSRKLENLGWRAIFNLKDGINKTLRFYSEN